MSVSWRDVKWQDVAIGILLAALMWVVLVLMLA